MIKYEVAQSEKAPAVEFTRFQALSPGFFLQAKQAFHPSGFDKLAADLSGEDKTQ